MTWGNSKKADFEAEIEISSDRTSCQRGLVVRNTLQMYKFSHLSVFFLDFLFPLTLHLRSCAVNIIIARDAFIRTNHSAIAIMFVRPSVCMSVCLYAMGMHCNHTVQIYVYGWIVQCSGHPDTKACPPTPSRLFPVPPGKEVGYGCAN